MECWKASSKYQREATALRRQSHLARSQWIVSIDLVKVKISQKRFDPSNPNAGTYEDHVWFDCEYVPAALAKATRAVKGLLEFSDHFGEVKFRIQVTVNEPLTPGRSLVQKAIGFTYNQFMEPHQWMLVTKEGDMKCTLRLTNVLYTDGSTEVLP